MIICSCKDNDFNRENHVLVTDFSVPMCSGIWSDREGREWNFYLLLIYIKCIDVYQKYNNN